MQGYILRRLLGIALNLVIVSLVIFLALRLVPQNVAADVLGQNATPEQYHAFNHKYGLDDPAPAQFLRWIGGVLHGDFGRSFRTNARVGVEFRRRFPITLEVVVLSFAFTAVMGVVFGAISALRQNSPLDYGVRLFSIFGLSIPNFLLLTCLLIFPARWWGYAPPFGATDLFKNPSGNLQLYVPATFMLAIGAAATLMRLTRSAFLEVVRQDYVRTARAKGLREGAIVLRHELRNAMLPVLTLMGLQLGALLGGSIILEQVMGLPGLGTWALAAIGVNDYPVVMAVALYAAITVMVINLLVDLSYVALDPRIRLAH
ncbi:MAG TPA: ABC transporter permease [Dehalococcoidia bacterium]|nr:ABC transporter permease [Dehalococcoidia bacterium]